MYNPAVQRPRRCACTLLFSLHLTVMILGIVGMVLGIVIVAIHFYPAYCWPLISGGLAFASGLQGLLVHNDPSGRCYNCHAILAVINLINVAVFGVACLFVVNPLWVIWAIAVFAMELWVTIASFCCNRGGAPRASMELPTAQPNAVHVVQGHPANGGFDPHGYAAQPQGGYGLPVNGGFDPHGYASQPQGGYKQPYMP